MDTLLLQTAAQLPQHLKALRKARGLTQTQLAAQLRLTQARYAKIEKHPQSVSTAQLLAILAALGVDILLRVRHTKSTPPAGDDW